MKNLKVLAAVLVIPVIVAAPLKTMAATTPIKLPVPIKPPVTTPAPVTTPTTSSTINAGAKISFTFDDGYTSALTAATTLASHGMTGTSYIITNCVGLTGTAAKPNTCRADGTKSYMTWAQIQSLQNTYGWEIGSHTVDHDCLASNATIDPDDCQTASLTTAQVDTELTASKATLAANGITATDMATPYGDYNPSVLTEISKYYASQRGFADTGYNAAPYNQYIIRDQIATGGVKLATLEADVQSAITNKQWLVFTFHDIEAKASNSADDYEYSTANLDALAAYVQKLNVPVVNINKGLISGTNMMSNPSFDSAMTGWTTDDATDIKLNTGNNGSYPSPTNSVSFTSSAKIEHLFSPKVAVSSSNTYMLQSFLNLSKITAGQSLGYYIDEYNSAGAWISGQYKQSDNFAWSQTTGFEYKPSSTSVASASIQFIVPANSGASGYVDNFQWINESTGTTTTTPPVNPTNLVTNGTFDAGISGGWTTDGAANITADAANNGDPANAVNSVKMVATTANKHLFSPKVTVDSTKSYTLSTYVNIKALTSGEIGFYVDEYDASGNWVSGKYVTGTSVVGANTVSFGYTPTSANVKSASLQIILVASSGITAYVDNITWFQN